MGPSMPTPRVAGEVVSPRVHQSAIPKSPLRATPPNLDAFALPQLFFSGLLSFGAAVVEVS